MRWKHKAVEMGGTLTAAFVALWLPALTDGKLVEWAIAIMLTPPFIGLFIMVWRLVLWTKREDEARCSSTN